MPMNNGEMQSVPAKAALHNLRAEIILKRDPKQVDAARNELQAALKIQSDFDIAKRGLAELDKP